MCFYHSSGGKDHESCLIPSLGALKYQLLHAEIVLKTVFSCCGSGEVNAIDHGWSIVDGEVQVVWDTEEVMEKLKCSKGCGCKAMKCDGSRVGCRSCFMMCRPCNAKCKCKAMCNNPHNNGGTCPKCVESEEEADESCTEEREDDHQHFDTDSSDEDEQ